MGEGLRRRVGGARVAYVCADPGIGVFGTKGASVHVQEVVRVLRAAGADVVLHATRTGGEPPADLADVVVQLLPTRPRGGDVREREAWLIAQDDAIADAVDLAGTDLLYERYSLFSAAALERARAAGIPTVLEVNAPLVDEQAAHRGLVHADAAWESLRRAVTAADVVTCVSEPVAAWVREHVPGARTVVAANGVNTERIRPREAHEPRETPDVPTIGFVGTLKPWHGVEVLLEAAAPLVRDGVARLLIVGDGPLAADLDARAVELGITAGVERTGATDPADVPALLRRTDVAVAPYPAVAEEYFSPLKVYEYLAAGLPVVASAVGQIPAVVRDGVTGVLLPPSDVVALRDALELLCAHAPTRERMGRAARADAVEHHGWERTVATAIEALPPTVLDLLTAEESA
ncbi:glycosyltransferase family 4 protein [Litorihabitans aurantiacus]|uniref:glycosyltransferase family 4 protein n=1 Tax=Litorihabitans aurantiacus TaxID=1930061 RepID=UPI0024E12719|nr:glycosyltransferase family 4 protein [Litorihabitans aurantiacus]